MSSDPADVGVRRERPKRLDTIECIYQVALLTLRRNLRGGRIILTLVVVLLPLALSIPVSRNGDLGDQEEFFYVMLSVYQFGIAVPAVALAFATAFPWPEAEEGTLTYWFTAPARRWTIHLGRYLAAWVVGTLVLPLGVLAIAAPLNTPPSAQLRDVATTTVAATLLAYPAYLAFFWLLSAWSRRGLVIGVVFVLVENFLSFLPANVVRITLIYYVRSTVFGAVPRDSRHRAEKFLMQMEPVSASDAAFTFAAVTLVTLVLSLLVVEAIEYRSKTSQAT